MLALAARFYDPTSGTIRLDGATLSGMARQDLRQRVAVVTQELFLFHASLRENICYGVPGASDAQVEEVVEAAQLQGPALRKKVCSRKVDKCGTVLSYGASDMPIMRARSSPETRV